MYTPPDQQQMAMPPADPRHIERHMLAWLSAEGWAAAQATTEPQHKAAFKLWQAQDWPVIVRRTDVDAATDQICLGLPLPPDEDTGEKVRIALRAHVGHIKKVASALELAAVLRSSESPWRAPLAALERDAAGMHLRVYGSMAMQTITELPYVSPTSDVDILFHPGSRRQLEDGVSILSRHATLLPLDGEIVFPGGAAVSWKEWRMAIANPAKVMVKELHSVRLADTDALLSLLEPS
ncbi:MAG TPA: malonate decarboxylase holo-[acyl-carrier-protein] synthase [Duganella sp.]|jgi:phosphoribosyl-dephospho-CoA transferase